MIPETKKLKLIDTVCPTCGETKGEIVGRGVDFEYRTSDDEFTMVSCAKCSVIRLHPRPAPSELSTIYPPHYIPYHFDSKLGLVSRVARKFFLRGRVNLTRQLVGDSASILDVGCGNGDLLLLMHEFGSKDWKLTGMDIGDRVGDRLRERGITFVLGRFEDVQSEENQWDCIWMKDVIEHLDNPSELMARASQLLKPGGVLIMETPNYEGLDARLFHRRYWGGWHFPRHWTVYTSKNLKETLLGLGFHKVFFKSTLSPNFWAQSIHHWLTERKVINRFADWFFAGNFLLMMVFSTFDALMILVGRNTSNMQVVAQKQPR